MMKMRRDAVLFALGAIVAEGGTLAQSTISGRVVADDSGEPIPNAGVGLVAPSVPEAAVLTDADGRFTFDVGPGDYTVTARKTRYAAHAAAAIRVGQPLDIRLQRGAVISGRVIDDAGEPVIAARVTAETISGSIVATTDTDDRGEYRLGSLRPDTFILASTSPTRAPPTMGRLR